ncbi:hypothetical protein CLOM_g18478 [Closterium sp. NIES-68]|nr:hypothetical protein CLOM_g18478 [Closterium sp. NIES-68]GJP69515.1 hypothetical protein CLOP_g520 [Closterium sp. NIES-67]
MGCLEDSKKSHPPPNSKSCIKCLTPYAIALGVLVAMMTLFHVSPSQPSPGLIGSSVGGYLPPNLGWVAFLFPSTSKIDATICRAEENYWENIEHRRDIFHGVLQPILGNTVRMKELVLIPTYTCPLNERIGKWGDGGKWACMLPSAIQKKDPVVYSIGSFGMYSFEKEMHRMLRTKPYTFDPFLPPAKRAVMASLPFLHFLEIGLSGSATLPSYRSKFPEKTFSTLPEMMRQFGHTYVDVFKIDCEGCEVELLRDLGEEYNNTGKRLAVHGGKLPFGQILIEFHNMGDSAKTLTMFYTLENLGYRMFSIEYNHRCAACCEMSFIHESLVRPDSATDCRPFLAPPLEDGLEVEVVSEGGGAADGGAAAGDAADGGAGAGDAADGGDAGDGPAGDAAGGAGDAADGAGDAVAGADAGSAGDAESTGGDADGADASGAPADDSAGTGDSAVADVVAEGEGVESASDTNESGKATVEESAGDTNESGKAAVENSPGEAREDEVTEGEGETASEKVSVSRKVRGGGEGTKKSKKESMKVKSKKVRKVESKESKVRSKKASKVKSKKESMRKEEE